MKKLLEVLSNRRVWAAIVGGVAMLLTYTSTNFQIDVPVLTGLLTDFGGSLSTTIISGLALWSYFVPKK